MSDLAPTWQQQYSICPVDGDSKPEELTVVFFPPPSSSCEDLLSSYNY